ncbi:putative pentatricopeptide repeat protein [Rosellinia necatrix]|uniref:Putative pentatricopeptide repeat protein n=1 Tax=Rosellinia necatrix TaxID=77044 RepID=A0A1W2TEK7_ROSNE|nr:putative pentatricopeptide repeat protein [Rosellinia necatrix]
MRGSNPVCLLCRLQVGKAIGKTRSVQWQTQPARISTTPRRHDGVAAGRAATDECASPETASDPSISPPYLRKILLDGHGRKSNVPASRTRMTREQPSTQVDALFQQIIQEQEDLENAAGLASAHESPSVNLSLVKAIANLQDMIDGNTPVADAYSYFQSEISPTIQTPGIHVPQAYDKVKFAMLNKLATAKKNNIVSRELPAVADIYRIYAEAGELKPKQWVSVVGKLVTSIIKIDLSVETLPPVVRERQRVLREAMIADLVESWKVLSLPRPAIAQTGESELTDGFWFPRLDKFSLAKFAKKGNFATAFSTLFPQYPRNQLGSPVAVLAIATFALMHDSQRCPVNTRRKAARFVSKVADLIKYVNYNDKVLQRGIQTTFPALEPYIMGLWPKITAHLRQNYASDDGGSTETYKISLPSDNKSTTPPFDADSIGRRLSRLHGVGNQRELDELWEEFVGSGETISAERAAQIRECAHIIDSFIKIRMTYNQPDKAIVTWNVLGKVGLKPSLRTWNLMLDGLRKAGNINGIKNIWAKLAKSGIQLDTAIWTTRIAGLVDCGDFEGGLHALEEMARLVENDTSGTAVPLTIEPINAALTGLIHRRQHGAAEKLLAWAGRKGIHPDTFTFNTMLRVLIRDKNRSKDVQNLFATMQAEGVQANEATFTIVLDASFSKEDTLSPKEQTRIVAEVASTMEAAGLELNMKTYGKMIYLLLYSNARAAAMAVVHHLYSQNLELSPHIYTMLIENCFAQTPPALDSVHLIVQRRRHVDFDDMDHIFYERVIRGYAQANEARAALDVYKHVSSAGGIVALGALDDLLRALLRQNHLEGARELVNREKKRFESLHPDSENHTPYWNHQFWQLASSYKLLDSPLPIFGRPGTLMERGQTTAANDDVTPS